MKSLKLFFTLTLLSLFLSCDKDDENMTAVDIDSLIGRWSLTFFEADIDLETNLSGISITSTSKSVGENFDYILTFTETTYAVEGGYDLVTTGTINGMPIDEDKVTISGISESGNYELSDGAITIEGQLYEFEINDMETEELSLDQSLDIAFNGDGDLVMTQKHEASITQEGIPFDFDVDATMILKRIE